MDTGYQLEIDDDSDEFDTDADFNFHSLPERKRRELPLSISEMRPFSVSW